MDSAITQAKNGTVTNLGEVKTNPDSVLASALSSSVPKETMNLGGQQPVRNPYTG